MQNTQVVNDIIDSKEEWDEDIKPSSILTREVKSLVKTHPPLTYILLRRKGASYTGILGEHADHIYHSYTSF